MMFWYRGLALGGIAAAGHLQPVQPSAALTLAALRPRERIETGMVGIMPVLFARVVGARHFSTRRTQA